MKWTRREETDFYRVISTYGIEFDRHKGRYIWDKFRVMAPLDKKTDEQLTEYFISFYHMCLRVCRKIKKAYPPIPVYIEPITEERANRCIARIDLLSKIREEIIIHPKMEQRVKLCQKSIDLPTWWKCGQHDRELLVGAAKHGLARTDYYIMNDKGLSFHDVIKGFIQKHSNSPADFKMFGKDLEKKDVKSEKDEKPDVKSEDDKDEKSDKDPKDETDKSSDEKDESVKVERVKTEGIDDEDDQTIPSADDSEDLKDKKSSPVKDNESESATTKSVKKEKTDSESEKDDTVDNDDSDKKDKDNDGESDSKSKAMDVDNDDEDTDIGENMEVEEVAEKSTEKAKEKSPAKQEKSDDKSEVKEEKEIKDEEKEEMKKEIKDEDDLKSEADEEVRLALEDEESGLFASVSQNLLAQWPKDRVVFHRLEQICYCVETGDWPFPPKMKNLHILGIDSNSNTPTRSMTPQTPKLEEESREGKDTPVQKPTPKEKDFEVQMAEGEGLKMTFHKKPEKNRRSMPDPAVEAEKAARIQAILAQSIAQSQASSDDSQQDSILSSMSQSGADSPFLNGGPPMSEEEMMMNRHLLEQGLLFPRQGRRGRKRKEEKMAEIAMAEALARRQTARALSNIDSDSRVPVINLEDGSRLSGEEAPLKKNIEKWLIQHPGYMVDSRVEDLEEGEILADYPERRKGRKPKFDPAYLEVDKLTGEENVSVIHRLNGKKITGAKAPPLRFLAEWLEQNPMWDVDPKWSELVRQKGSLPKTLLPRIGTPSRRGRKPRDSPLSHPMLGNLGTSDPHQAAALAASMEAMNAAQLMAAGFGKLPLPFGSIPGLGLNPMLGLTGFPAFPGMGLEKSESKHKDSKGSKDRNSDKSKEDETSSSPHPSFPLMYNPLLFNPALLAAQGLANFPLPTSLAGLDASYLNGHTPQKEEPSTSSRSSSSNSKSRTVTSDYSDHSRAEDLSIRSSSSKKSSKVVENTTIAHSASKPKLKMDASMDEDDMPCDLSMKPKSKEEKSKQKICSSDKLSRIVDSLKFRVNKMDEKPSRDEPDSRRHSMDAVLNLTDKSSDSKSKHSDSSSSKKDSLNSLSMKLGSSSSSSSLTSSSSSSNHKESVPKIVQELLAAKQQRDREELMAASKQTVGESPSKMKSLKESLLKRASSTQGSDIGDMEQDSDDENS